MAVETKRAATERNSSKEDVRRIIAEARDAPAPAFGAWLLGSITAVLYWASFTPLEWGPLAWVCLLPVLLLVRIRRPTAWMYVALYVTFLAAQLAQLQWMRLGDPYMYFAWIALALYLAFYLPVFVAIARVAVHTFRLPLLVTAPAIWVGLEYAQAHLLSGFAWYYLGHSQYRWIEIIQIADLVGAYGVSFVIVMVSASLAILVPNGLFRRLQLVRHVTSASAADDPPAVRRAALQVAVAVGVFAVALGYGYYRRQQGSFREGIRVALVQGNFTSSLKKRRDMRVEILETHDALTGLAVRHQPDLIVWPETMFPWPLRSVAEGLGDEELLKLLPAAARLDADAVIRAWRAGDERRRLSDDSRKAGAALLIGIETHEATADGLRRYNSAVFVRPDVGIVGRYDKRHLVPFGEYIPFQKTLPFLRALTPFGPEFGLEAGRGAVVFEYRGTRFVPLICFEDTVPHLVRRYVAESSREKPLDLLVNLTNDGWFHGSSELDQHLITAAFRAVECRTPMVRAVNTGISAVIDGDGVIVEPDVFIDADGQGRTGMRDPHTRRWHKQLNAVLVDSVPLDPRSSLYVRWGDWFAATCCLLALVVGLAHMLERARQRLRPGATAAETAAADESAATDKS